MSSAWSLTEYTESVSAPATLGRGRSLWWKTSSRFAITAERSPNPSSSSGAASSAYRHLEQLKSDEGSDDDDGRGEQAPGQMGKPIVEVIEPSIDLPFNLLEPRIDLPELEEIKLGR
jgi:hypothetical protein